VGATEHVVSSEKLYMYLNKGELFYLFCAYNSLEIAIKNGKQKR